MAGVTQPTVTPETGRHDHDISTGRGLAVSPVAAAMANNGTSTRGLKAQRMGAPLHSRQWCYRLDGTMVAGQKKTRQSARWHRWDRWHKTHAPLVVGYFQLGLLGSGETLEPCLICHAAVDVYSSQYGLPACSCSTCLPPTWVR